MSFTILINVHNNSYGLVISYGFSHWIQTKWRVYLIGGIYKKKKIIIINNKRTQYLTFGLYDFEMIFEQIIFKIKLYKYIYIYMYFILLTWK